MSDAEFPKSDDISEFLQELDSMAKGYAASFPEPKYSYDAVCQACGVRVFNTALHTMWHKALWDTFQAIQKSFDQIVEALKK